MLLFKKEVICAILCVLVCTTLQLSAAAKKPNFIVLFVDDLGYGDLSCFGNNKIYTPNIDAMAAQGMKFTQWISAYSVCTPSRASLLTGRLAVRSGMSANILRTLIAPGQPSGLPRSEKTIASVLKQSGYTSGMGGKWHLGLNRLSNTDGYHLPTKYGFDNYLGFPMTNNPACVPGKEQGEFCFLYANTTLIQQPMRMQNLTGELTTHAVNFIRDQTKAGNPFFYFMSYVHVHTALFSSPAFTGVSKGGAYGDNVQEVDWSVGEILNTLRELGIDDNTLVFFTSDNGPYLEEGVDGGTAGELKGGKGQTYEGGIRVPGIAWWPGKIPESRTLDTLVNSMDIFNTIVTNAGAELPTDRELDGKDISSVLFGETTKSPHEFMFHYCGVNISAARHGRYKAHFRTANWTSQYMEDPPCQECCPHVKSPANVCGCISNLTITHDPPLLYDMHLDPNEKHILTPDNFPMYWKEITAIKAAMEKHYSTIKPVKNQLNVPFINALNPCCHDSSTTTATSNSSTDDNCYCDNPPPNIYADKLNTRII